MIFVAKGSVIVRSPSSNRAPPSKGHKTTLGALSTYAGSQGDRGICNFKYRRGTDRDAMWVPLLSSVPHWYIGLFRPTEPQFVGVTSRLYSESKDSDLLSRAASHSSELRLDLLPSSVRLTDEQQKVLDLVLSGVSLFFTGSAGMLWYAHASFSRLANAQEPENHSCLWRS